MCPGKDLQLRESNIRGDFTFYVKEFKGSSKADTFVEGNWKVFLGTLQETTSRACGWINGPARHKETWWRDDDINTVIMIVKYKILKI